MVFSRSFPLVARIVACSRPRGVICSTKASSADNCGLLLMRRSIATLIAQVSNLRWRGKGDVRSCSFA